MIIEINEKEIELLLNKLNVTIEKAEHDIKSPMLWEVEKAELNQIIGTSNRIIDVIMGDKPDIKYLNIPNVCFSLTKEDDLREAEFSKQRIERGFDDSELWSFRDTIGSFILPRLKAFRGDGSGAGFPAKFDTRAQWDKKLDKMITAFELLIRDNGMFDLSKKEWRKYKKGMSLYHKYFLHLWC